MVVKADNTQFAIDIVDKFIKVLSRHIRSTKGVEKGGYISLYGLKEAQKIDKFKAEGLKTYNGTNQEKKDDKISTIVHVLKYYEIINEDIQGSQEIFNTFDKIDRNFSIPSPTVPDQEEVRSYEPELSRDAQDLMTELQEPTPEDAETAATKAESDSDQDGMAWVKEPGAIAKTADGRLGRITSTILSHDGNLEVSLLFWPEEESSEYINAGSLTKADPSDTGYDDIATGNAEKAALARKVAAEAQEQGLQGERPPPQPGTQENISIYEIRDDEYYGNYTIELKIAVEQLKKFNRELNKPPGESRMVIKPEDYKNAENDYKDALKRGKILANLNKQIEKGVEEIVQRRGGETKLEEINKEINETQILTPALKIYLESQIETEPGKDPDIKDAKINIEGTITYLTQRYEVIKGLLEGLNVAAGGGKKKRTHNKKKRRSKKKSTPVKKKK